MTWTRLDDGWTDQAILESLSYETRWHYLALIQFCSRTGRYDGFIRASDARRASDVPHPAEAIAELSNVGLIAPAEGGYVLPLIASHVPPPHMRDEARKQAQRDRKRRERRHKAGDHTYCDHATDSDQPPPTNTVSRVTSPVTSGRDGTGQDREPNYATTGRTDGEADWPAVTLPAVDCEHCAQPLQTGLVALGRNSHPSCATAERNAS